MRRVVITGIGCVTPIGTGADGLWEGLRRRRSAVGPITRFDPTPFRSHIAAEIPDFAPDDHLSAKELRRLDRFSQLGVAAARLALHDAGLRPDQEDRDRAQNPVCGDTMRLFIRVESNRIVDVKFLTIGCSAAIASSSLATEVIKGKTIEEALQVSDEAIINALGGLPPSKIHCSILAEMAIQAAIEDYRKKSELKSTKVETA